MIYQDIILLSVMGTLGVIMYHSVQVTIHYKYVPKPMFFIYSIFQGNYSIIHKGNLFILPSSHTTLDLLELVICISCYFFLYFGSLQKIVVDEENTLNLHSVSSFDRQYLVKKIYYLVSGNPYKNSKRAASVLEYENLYYLIEVKQTVLTEKVFIHQASSSFSSDM